MFLLSTRRIHLPAPARLHAPVARNTPSQYPDSTPIQLPRTIPKPRCPLTLYHAPPAPQYQSSPLTPYPISSTTHGDTFFTSPIPTPLQ